MLLVLAISVTFVGPFAIALLKRTRFGTRLTQEGDPEHWSRIVYLVVAALAAFGIIPQVMRVIGFWSVGVMLGGVAIAWGCHKLIHGRQNEALGGAAMAAVALGGVALHSFLDGAMLFSFGQAEAARYLAPLVLLDRVTIGLVAWSLTAPTFGWKAGVASLVALAATTLSGFFAVGFIVSKLTEDPIVGILNAGLAGIVLYMVVAHAKEHHRDDPFFHFDAKGHSHDHAHGHSYDHLHDHKH